SRFAHVPSTVMQVVAQLLRPSEFVNFAQVYKRTAVLLAPARFEHCSRQKLQAALKLVDLSRIPNPRKLHYATRLVPALFEAVLQKSARLRKREMRLLIATFQLCLELGWKEQIEQSRRRVAMTVGGWKKFAELLFNTARIDLIRFLVEECEIPLF